VYGNTVTNKHRDTFANWHCDTVTNKHCDTVTNKHRDTVTNKHRDTVTNKHRDTVTNKHCDTVTNKHCDTVTSSSSSSIDYPNAINDVEGPQCHADKYNYTYVNNDAHKHQITDDDQNAKCDQKCHAGIECTNQCNV
jgi:hypothetical protein